MCGRRPAPTKGCCTLIHQPLSEASRGQECSENWGDDGDGKEEELGHQLVQPDVCSL